MKLCFATNNKGKINEISALLKESFEIVSLKDIGCHEDLPETHETFMENSAEKALYVFNKYHINCFADDSGLEVDALNGAPGVYSARYAGKHGDDKANIDLLLKNMQGQTNRKARFRTVITLVIDGSASYFDGIVEGHITDQQIGNEGFGYDPVFIPDGYDKTFAQFSTEEKNSISHRGKAVRQLVAYLSKEFQP